MINIRKAEKTDIKQIAAIYEHIHNEESCGRFTTGWIKGVYPVEQTAADAVARDDMYVCEDEGSILASTIINYQQVDVYADGDFIYEAPDLSLIHI